MALESTGSIAEWLCTQCLLPCFAGQLSSGKVKWLSIHLGIQYSVHVLLSNVHDIKLSCILTVYG